jgi:hypothetical protein
MKQETKQTLAEILAYAAYNVGLKLLKKWIAKQ